MLAGILLAQRSSLFLFFSTPFIDPECLNLLQELEGSAPGGKFLSFDLPMGGDNDDIVAAVLVGLEFVLVNDDSRLCLGKIGETKVCLCLAKDCRVRSHQSV